MRPSIYPAPIHPSLHHPSTVQVRVKVQVQQVKVHVKVQVQVHVRPGPNPDPSGRMSSGESSRSHLGLSGSHTRRSG
eukprot:2084550-Karenia_brevis.AAC.1